LIVFRPRVVERKHEALASHLLNPERNREVPVGAEVMIIFFVLRLIVEHMACGEVATKRGPWQAHAFKKASDFR